MGEIGEILATPYCIYPPCGTLFAPTEIDESGQVVAVAVEPLPAGMRAQDGSFVFTLLLEEVGCTEDGVMVVTQPLPLAQQGGGEQNLVEEVPRPFIK